MKKKEERRKRKTIGAKKRNGIKHISVRVISQRDYMLYARYYLQTIEKERGIQSPLIGVTTA